MNKFRRIGAMVAAAVAATGMAMTVATAPAAAAPQPKGPQPVWSILPTVNENSNWKLMSVGFKTDVKACNFKLRLVEWGEVDILYPGFKPYTSLSNDDTLGKNEVDWARFWVKTGDYKPGTTWQPLPGTIYWSKCGKKAKLQTKYIGLVLPVKGM